MTQIYRQVPGVSAQLRTGARGIGLALRRVIQTSLQERDHDIVDLRTNSYLQYTKNYCGNQSMHKINFALKKVRKTCQNTNNIIHRLLANNNRVTRLSLRTAMFQQ